MDEKYLINPSLLEVVYQKPLLNIAVMASGAGTNFEAIINSINSNDLNAKVSVLIVNKACNAIKIAKSNNIPYEYINHNDFDSRESFDIEILKRISKYKVEGIVLAGWMRILSVLFINEYKDKIINIHPSLLPAFKGSNAIEKALKYGCKITGCTVHKVVEDIDSGKIIIQAAVLIEDNETVDSLRLKIQKREHEIIVESIKIISADWKIK